MQDTATTAGLIYVMVIGASVFNYFISVSQLPSQIILAIETLNVSPVAIIALIFVVYTVLGAFFDEVAPMLITLPFVMPLIHLLVYDPMWWGIINVTVVMIGLYCPPNIMVMHGLVKNVPLRASITARCPICWRISYGSQSSGESRQSPRGYPAR